MGVAGSGKTTIGELLASRLAVEFSDGDAFHPAANIKKMSDGIPLTDEDRYGWLAALNARARQCIGNGRSLVIACSALKESYRQLLASGIEDSVEWIYLKGDLTTLQNRMKNRKGHFMPPELLPSQMATLEQPTRAVVIDIAEAPETIINNIVNQLNKSAFGMAGLGVMGKSLARNFARNSVSLSLYNRFVSGTEERVAAKCIAAHPELHEAKGFEDLRAFVESLQKPRKIFIMIKAGTETDAFIEQLVPLLEPGDVLIDGGNSHYLDTRRRIEYLQSKNLHFIGTGVSGGELGALNGPSLMPSGPVEAYRLVEEYLNLIAAKDADGKPCCNYIGPEGSGHFVKMVHNGIEYAEMQLIAEVYAHLRYSANLQPPDIAAVFAKWNAGSLSSYLLEITAALLLKKEGDAWLIDLILDKAGNKGTGNWATIAAAELGQPATLLTAALMARYVSTLKAAVNIQARNTRTATAPSISPGDLKGSYTLARIVNHQQGFVLIQTASETYGWKLNLSEIARIWTNGCIIRSAFMKDLVAIVENEQDLLSNKIILEQLQALKPALKGFCLNALQLNLPVPCHLAALDYLNTLPGIYATANIIQAQRDYFGAHGYQKRGDETGKLYHSQWPLGAAT